VEVHTLRPPQPTVNHRAKQSRPVFGILCAPPGGEPRQASQRNKRNVGSAPANISPIWRASMPVSWSGRAGVFRREVGDGEHAEVLIDGRVYRVHSRELS
jgi:hypothetical protein